MPLATVIPPPPDVRPASIDTVALPPGRRNTGVITVCHPIWKLADAGMERQMVQLLATLPADEFRHVVVVRDDSPLPAALHRPHVTVVRSRSGRHRLWPFHLSARLREHAVDILHVRGLALLPDAAIAARLAGRVKLALSFHGLDDYTAQPGRLRLAAYRRAVLRCDARWAVARDAARQAGALLDLPNLNFDILPNGVRTDRYRPPLARAAARAVLDLPQDRPVILCVGNLKHVKGQDVLLAAARRLAPSDARPLLCLVGGDYQDGRLQATAAHTADGSEVRFVGPVRDPLPWYQAADLFVLPSRSEGLSNALLEAMACELPIIATRVGGNPEAIHQGATGLLVPPEDAAALAGAMDLLLRDATYRIDLARAARRRAVERFSAEACAARYAAAYAALAASGAETAHAGGAP